MSNPALTEAVFYILLSLMRTMHGYGIMQNVEALSDGRVRLAAGTLYGAINTLLESIAHHEDPVERMELIRRATALVKERAAAAKAAMPSTPSAFTPRWTKTLPTQSSEACIADRDA